MDSAQPGTDRCAQLDRKLAHVVERRFRLVVVREQLLAGSPEEGCRWLAQAIDRTPSSRSSSDPLRDAIVAVLMGDESASATGDSNAPPVGLPYAFRRDLYAAAVAAGADRLAALLRSHAGEPEAAPAGRRLAPDVAEIPLGVRRSLAKGRDPLLLEKLALDPDPIVIANLLRNARLREVDVVRIAALRPVPVSTLEEVARSSRWMARASVRVTLARNPYSPVALAVELIGGLPLTDLRAMRRDPDLPAETLDHIESELKRRGVAHREPAS